MYIHYSYAAGYINSTPNMHAYFTLEESVSNIKEPKLGALRHVLRDLRDE